MLPDFSSLAFSWSHFVYFTVVSHEWQAAPLFPSRRLSFSLPVQHHVIPLWSVSIRRAEIRMQKTFGSNIRRTWIPFCWDGGFMYRLEQERPSIILNRQVEVRIEEYGFFLEAYLMWLACWELCEISKSILECHLACTHLTHTTSDLARSFVFYTDLALL